MTDTPENWLDLAIRLVAIGIGVKLFIIPEPASSATGVAIIATAIGAPEILGAGGGD